jgi:hypothetical protein
LGKFDFQSRLSPPLPSALPKLQMPCFLQPPIILASALSLISIPSGVHFTYIRLLYPNQSDETAKRVLGKGTLLAAAQDSYNVVRNMDFANI